MFADRKSMHGLTCAQVFVTLEVFVKVYPMSTMGDAYNALNNFSTTVGLPHLIVKDNQRKSMEVTGKW